MVGVGVCIFISSFGTTTPASTFTTSFFSGSASGSGSGGGGDGARSSWIDSGVIARRIGGGERAISIFREEAGEGETPRV